MRRGLIRTFWQVSSLLLLRKQRSEILDDLKANCYGKSILICGAGPSLARLQNIIHQYDVVVGVNGLSRYYAESHGFNYFFIEDYEAYLNYHQHFDGDKIILAAGMPGHRSRQLPFIHFYGFPKIFSRPFFSRTGHIFFWAGSVIPFAVNVIALSKPRSIDVLGFDLSRNGHFIQEYRLEGDLVNTTDWELQRRGAFEVFSRASKMGISVRSIGECEWPEENAK